MTDQKFLEKWELQRTSGFWGLYKRMLGPLLGGFIGGCIGSWLVVRALQPVLLVSWAIAAVVLLGLAPVVRWYACEARYKDIKSRK